ncbi:hypothetical protein A2U01_0103086, partial [Trifolium medium]|nr:hypothetical protein [Trifolium medium]
SHGKLKMLELEVLEVAGWRAPHPRVLRCAPGLLGGHVQALLLAHRARPGCASRRYCS